LTLLLVVAAAVTALVGVPLATTVDEAKALPLYRATYHFTVPDGWKNDPQRPIYVNGQYQYYYLYNPNYPSVVGTSWRMATSTDGVHWADQFVAAPKNTNVNADLWSGSTVVDTNNTVGFGAGAIIMIVTQAAGGVGGPQSQFLWYSTDGGRNFTPYGTAPVLANPGVTDFRDPKVSWDADRGRWVMLLAEGARIGIYTSSNLKTWTYIHDFVTSGIGTVECPDLYKIRATDGTIKWVIAASANGFPSQPNTYAYWVGSFDGTTFTPDSTTPQWLDYGFDWYAGVTWEDATAPLDRRFAVGWLNNWAYADNTPTWANDGFNGTDSVTRQITLKKYGTAYSLASTTDPALSTIVSSTTNVGTVSVNGNVPLSYHGISYQFDADATWTTATNVGVQVRRSSDGVRKAELGVYAGNGSGGYSYLNRGPSVSPDTSGQRLESHAPFDFTKKTVHLRVMVDSTSVEIFVDDGRYVHSSEVFPTPSDDGIALYSTGGTATFTNVTIKTLSNVQQRGARLLNNFEGTTYGTGWTATGSYVGQGPVNWAAPGKVELKYVDTAVNGGDAATGIITSPSFLIDRKYLRFKLGGGNHPLGQSGATSVQLLINGTAVKTQTGDNSGNLSLYTWDLTAYAGQTAQFQILDQSTSSTWGHILVDHPLLTD
jgi:levanbiose-producing levanase